MDGTEYKLRNGGGNMTVDEVLVRTAQLCRGYGAKEVLLFGSRAKGTDTDRSEIHDYV